MMAVDVVQLEHSLRQAQESTPAALRAPQIFTLILLVLPDAYRVTLRMDGMRSQNLQNVTGYLSIRATLILALLLLLSNATSPNPNSAGTDIRVGYSTTTHAQNRHPGARRPRNLNLTHCMLLIRSHLRAAMRNGLRAFEF